MATDVTMPQLGLTMKEGQIMEWKKREGDAVKRGELLFSVENDKAVLDVDAQADGVLAKILVPEMNSALVGAVIAVISAPGEAVAEGPAALAAAIKPAVPATTSAAPVPTTAVKPAAVYVPTPADTAVPAGTARRTDGFVLASPLARKKAEQLGVRLADVRGTGPEGAVIARDLAGVGASVVPEHSRTGSGVSTAAQPAGVAYDDVQLSRIQRIAAERMADSWANIPQFTLYDEADATLLLDLAERFKKKGEPVSLTVIIAKLMAHAVARHPLLNASWLGDGSVRSYRSVNINVAVDTQDGLMVPVLSDCAGKGFAALGAEMKGLAEMAKAGKLGTQDHEGGTITLSNLGMFGIKRFRAIVNPPQTAILAVGSISERISSVDDGFEIRKVIEFSVTADHRVVDGAYAARFMATLRAMLENPALAMQ